MRLQLLSLMSAMLMLTIVGCSPLAKNPSDVGREYDKARVGMTRDEIHQIISNTGLIAGLVNKVIKSDSSDTESWDTKSEVGDKGDYQKLTVTFDSNGRATKVIRSKGGFKNGSSWHVDWSIDPKF